MGMVRSALLGLAAAGALLFGAGTAGAEGLPQRIKDSPYRPYSEMRWSGFYVGIQGGYGWGETEHRTAVNSSGTFDTSGGLVGVTWGTNWQRGNLVYGLESDFSFSSIDGDFATPACALASCFTDIRTLSTSRVRLGYAMDRSLVYVTGGLAYGNVRAGVPEFSVDDDKTRFGWTLGAGIEWAFAPRWSLKAEYLHVDLGDRRNYSAFGTSVDVDVTADIVRVGINYNLGPEFWGDMLGRR